MAPMGRCTDTHYYAQGLKVRSGSATWVDGAGRARRVVCGRGSAGSGEVHLHDLPDRAVLHHGDLALVFRSHQAYGRAGRRALAAGLTEVGTTQGVQAVSAYLAAALREVPLRRTAAGSRDYALGLAEACLELAEADPTRVERSVLIRAVGVVLSHEAAASPAWADEGRRRNLLDAGLEGQARLVMDTLEPAAQRLLGRALAVLRAPAADSTSDWEQLVVPGPTLGTQVHVGARHLHRPTPVTNVRGRDKPQGGLWTATYLPAPASRPWEMSAWAAWCARGGFRDGSPGPGPAGAASSRPGTADRLVRGRRDGAKGLRRPRGPW
mgnify:CR=1 FL=1